MCVLNWALLELCLTICFLLWPKRLCSVSSKPLAGAAAVVSIAWQNMQIRLYTRIDRLSQTKKSRTSVAAFTYIPTYLISMGSFGKLLGHVG